MTWGLDIWNELNSKNTHLPFVSALFKPAYNIYKCGALSLRERKENCNKDFGLYHNTNLITLKTFQAKFVTITSCHKESSKIYSRILLILEF